MQTALAYLQKADEAGYARAAFKLGFIYFDGDGVEKDVQTALAYLQLSWNLERDAV